MGNTGPQKFKLYEVLQLRNKNLILLFVGAIVYIYFDLNLKDLVLTEIINYFKVEKVKARIKVLSF